MRYYSGTRPYRRAGPPRLVLCMLGPLVVLTTLVVLGSGLALVAVGPAATFTTLVTVAGQRVTALTLHQASFIACAVATGLHVLARTVPAAQLAVTFRREPVRLDGALPRIAVLT